MLKALCIRSGARDRGRLSSVPCNIVLGLNKVVREYMNLKETNLFSDDTVVCKKYQTIYR